MNTDVYKTKLEAELDLLKEELGRIARQESNNTWVAKPDLGDGERADELDNADLDESYEERIAIIKVLEERYNQVTRALSLIADGSYGACEVCTVEIAEKRLDVNPSATTCIKHAT